MPIVDLPFLETKSLLGSISAANEKELPYLNMSCA